MDRSRRSANDSWCFGARLLEIDRACSLERVPEVALGRTRATQGAPFRAYFSERSAQASVHTRFFSAAARVAAEMVDDGCNNQGYLFSVFVR